MENKTTHSNEFENFDRMMQKLIKVPHSKIKAKLEAEKVEKKTNDTRRSRRDSGKDRS
jgi:hypothetical protein